MSNKKGLFKKLITANNGCGCGKPKPSDIYQPTPLPKSKPPRNPSRHYRSSSSSWDDGGDDDDRRSDHDYTSTTFSLNVDDTENDPTSSKTVSPCRKICRSDAVVKDSDDPYTDFRQSMLQMILEREIYTKDELQELLNCFLELNSPIHHEIIVRAFMEIWNGVIAKR